MRETLSIRHYLLFSDILNIMSKNVSGADNPQGSPLTILDSYDPSETTRRAPSTKKEIIAYLNGVAHDASLNKKRRIRFVQKEKK